jgi:division protein CdvB (Snf7/Vps24/ESCRT-III family)
MTADDKPALGAILARPDVQRRRAQHRFTATAARREHQARTRAKVQIANAYGALQAGDRLDQIASRLRSVADELDAIASALAAETP